LWFPLLVTVTTFAELETEASVIAEGGVAMVGAAPAPRIAIPHPFLKSFAAASESVVGDPKLIVPVVFAPASVAVVLHPPVGMNVVTSRHGMGPLNR
jgi:hypothetical protein